ncbi:Methyltransferase family protein isoform 6 [Hibiscus syriacus]|uniref:Methyltransferase family protein isoform 6 n=1 Tax=Hibiscus syriacus TaxID=106335 RepID=A0A6A3B0J1_HIBSY|nr:Methyltransferase family protein isoform 6 [Hibiscus syriacus]
MKEDYGLFVWPCSIVLAKYVWQQRSRFSGNDVVELGAGTCLPGLMQYTFVCTVYMFCLIYIQVLENMRTVCELNKLKCEVLGLTWGSWDKSIFSLHPKIILGADDVYDARAFDDLFATMTFLLQSNSGSVFITTYHNRSHHLIEFLMVKWGLKCVKLVDGFSLLPSDKGS